MTKEPTPKLTGRMSGLMALLSGHLTSLRSPQLYAMIVEWLNRPSWSTKMVLGLVSATIHMRRAVRITRLKGRTFVSKLTFKRRYPHAATAGAAAPRIKSLLCPTRGRPESVRRFVESVRRTCSRPADVEILFYVDDDDPTIGEYAVVVGRLKERFAEFKLVELVTGPPMSVSKSWNTLAQKCSGSLLMMANDDQLYIDYGWDYHLDKYVGESRDEIFAMFFEDGQYPPDGGDFPIVSRRWYETLGYFTPGIFEFWYNEAWIFDVANRLQRIIRIPKVLVEHLHYSNYKAVLDDTYKRHRLNFEKSDRDYALFERTGVEREAAAEKLRPLMVA